MGELIVRLRLSDRVPNQKWHMIWIINYFICSHPKPKRNAMSFCYVQEASSHFMQKDQRGERYKHDIFVLCCARVSKFLSAIMKSNDTFPYIGLLNLCFFSPAFLCIVFFCFVVLVSYKLFLIRGLNAECVFRLGKCFCRCFHHKSTSFKEFFNNFLNSIK